MDHSESKTQIQILDQSEPESPTKDFYPVGKKSYEIQKHAIKDNSNKNGQKETSKSRLRETAIFQNQQRESFM
jgi:hypothetical protein